MNERIEFKPPSDFVGEKGGGRSKLWTYLGVGCGLLLLVVGGATVFGAWKTASCCGDAMEAADYTMRAQVAGAEFAAAVSRGDADDAYSRTTEEFRSGIDRAQFVEQLSAHAAIIEAGAGQQIGMRALPRAGSGEGLQPNRWELAFEYAAPEASTKLRMTLNVVRRGEGESVEFLVDEVTFEERERILAAEAPAEEVLNFHRHLRRGDPEVAFGLMCDSECQRMQGGETAVEADEEAAFREFVGGEFKDVFLGEAPEVRSVSYDNDAATVVVDVEGADGGAWKITYKLVSWAVEDRWKILEVEPRAIQAPAEERATEDAAAAEEQEPAGAD